MSTQEEAVAGRYYQESFICEFTLFAAAAPVWFQAALQQLRADIRSDTRDTMRAMIVPDLKRVYSLFLHFWI
jgi:hypothetical protein